MEYFPRRRIDIVMYHSPCSDGLAAASCVYNWLSEPEHTLFIGINPNSPPDVEITNKSVLVLDTAFSKSVVDEYINKCSTFVIIDHHKSFYNELKGTKNYIYNVEKSACQMTWDIFYKTPRPLWIDYIGDRDLWKWSMEDSKPFTQYLYTNFPLTLETYNELFILLKDEQNINTFINKGKKQLEHDKIPIQLLCDNSVVCIFDKKYTVLLCESTIYRSEIGNILCKKNNVDFAMIWNYCVKRREFIISLRGDENKNYDMSEISKIYGGGGHELAAGFTYSGDFLKEKIIMY